LRKIALYKGNVDFKKVTHLVSHSSEAGMLPVLIDLNSTHLGNDADGCTSRIRTEIHIVLVIDIRTDTRTVFRTIWN